MSTSTERCDTDALLLVPPFWRRLADAPQETACGAFTEVVKALLQVLDRRFRIGVRGEEVVKGAVLRDELQITLAFSTVAAILLLLRITAGFSSIASTCFGLRFATYSGSKS
jgi:hypothetical protein